MKNSEKKYRRSGISTACYVIAALMFGDVCYQIFSTVQTINEYYASYGMSAQPIEYITYSLQSALQPIVYTIVIFMLGYILDAVRKNNKDNYLTDEELLDIADAKKKARETKKFAKGEAAAAKAGNVTTTEQSVEADFAKSLEEELKADEKKAEIKAEPKETKTESKPENKKPRSNYNRSNQNRQGGNKSSGGQRRNNNSSKKPAASKPKAEDAAKPKLEDASKAKADDGFEVVINEKEN